MASRRGRFVSWTACVLLAATPGLEAQTKPAPGSIAGRVEVPPGAFAPESSPRISDLGAAPYPPAPDRRESVVYLESAPQAAFEERPRTHATMDQLNEAFVPYVLPIMAGTTVDFPNRDRTYHNVFSLSRARSFDLGRYPRGESKSVRFDRPGVVRLFCEIHSRMSAFILVFAHHFFATTDAEGRYRIEGVPPGAYEVSVWTDGRVRETRSIRVPPGGTVEANFVVK